MSICIRIDSLILRPWKSEDAESLSHIGDDESIEINMNDGFPKPFSLDKAIQFIQNANKSKDLFLAIEKSGKVVGSIGAFYNDADRRSAVIAYFIGREYWNQGYATTAIKGLIEYLEKGKSIKEITADPFERNLGSRKVLEKSGFVLKGIVENGTMKRNKRINTCRYEYKSLS